MSDIGMLKAIADQTAEQAEDGGRWEAAEQAVENVLRVLYNTPSSKEMWQPVYDAIKAAYTSEPDWGDA